MLRVLIFIVSLGARAIRAICRRRADLVIVNLALRQQVTALKKERSRPRLNDTYRAFWVALRQPWLAWEGRLVIVNPDTKLMSAGIGNDSGDTGKRSYADGIQAALESRQRFAISSGRWLRTAGGSDYPRRDPYDPGSKGSKTTPIPDEITEQYCTLLNWYGTEYVLDLI